MNRTVKGRVEVDEARLRQMAIGSRLRQIFDEVVNEPIPDDFLDILRRAEPAADAADRASPERAPEGGGQ